MSIRAGCRGWGAWSNSIISTGNNRMEASPMIEPAEAPPAHRADPVKEPALGPFNQVSLRTFALAAVAARAGVSSPTTNGSVELEFLSAQLHAVTRTRLNWMEALPDYLRRP